MFFPLRYCWLGHLNEGALLPLRCGSDVCATLRPGTLWAHCHYYGILQIPIFLHLETLLLADADPMIMTTVEKPTGELPFWFITQRGPFAADLVLLWASSGGLGAMR